MRGDQALDVGAPVVQPNVDEQRERVEPAGSARRPRPVDEHDAAVGTDQDVVGAHVAMHQSVTDEVCDGGFRHVGERRKPRCSPIRASSDSSGSYAPGSSSSRRQPPNMIGCRILERRAGEVVGDRIAGEVGERVEHRRDLGRVPREMRMPSLDVFEDHRHPVAVVDEAEQFGRVG